MVLALLGVVGGAVAEREIRRFRRELDLARQEIDGKDWVAALPRLQALARSRAGWGGGEVDYWLGLAHWNTGRCPAALSAFRQVPSGSNDESRAGGFLAEDLLTTMAASMPSSSTTKLRLPTCRTGPKGAPTLLCFDWRVYVLRATPWVPAWS